MVAAVQLRFCVRGSAVESNQRYYHRRAAEERMAAQRAMTECAREWHAKLAQQFAARAAESQGLTLTA
jgi:hypothetical protein